MTVTRLPQSQRVNQEVFVCGPTASGKNFLMAREFVPQHRRVISIDPMMEAAETFPHAIEARGLDGVLRAIREATLGAAFAGERDPAWHIAAIGMHEMEAVELIDILAPAMDSKQESLSIALGGLAIECGEFDTLAPTSGTPLPVRRAIKAGRHYRLSVLMATQRPHGCSRLCTSQAHTVVSFAMHEPRDIAFLSDACGADFAEAVERLPRFWSVWRDNRTRVKTVRRKDGREMPLSKFLAARAPSDGTELDMGGTGR